MILLVQYLNLTVERVNCLVLFDPTAEALQTWWTLTFARFSAIRHRFGIFHEDFYKIVGIHIYVVLLTHQQQL